MRTKRRFHWIVAVVAAGALALAGCSSGEDDPDSENAKESSATYAVITHASPGDTFWDVVKNGAEDAGEQYGVTVEYHSNPDPAQQSQLIDQAVSKGVDGIAVSMANPDALRESISKAVAAGIPVVTLNSGVESFASVGAITHVGQTETIAGQQAAQRLKAAGVTKLLCVIEEVGNVALDQRCNGAAEVYGSSAERLQVDVSNVAEANSKIKARLQADSTIDGVLTLNPLIAIAARDAIKETGSSAKLATFDLSGDVVDAIKAGEILWAIDQQQYLQGWLPITFLHLYTINKNTVGGGLPVLTGPGFVTAENADAVAELARQGTR